MTVFVRPSTRYYLEDNFEEAPEDFDKKFLIGQLECKELVTNGNKVGFFAGAVFSLRQIDFPWRHG